MGLVVLHSGHFSKLFIKLMGTTCNLKWREAGEKERLWVVSPGHPIAAGLGEYFEIPHAEMYGELFDIPEPDTLVFMGPADGVCHPPSPFLSVALREETFSAAVVVITAEEARFSISAQVMKPIPSTAVLNQL
jgi:hypothetical protein